MFLSASTQNLNLDDTATAPPLSSALLHMAPDRPLQWTTVSTADRHATLAIVYMKTQHWIPLGISRASMESECHWSPYEAFFIFVTLILKKIRINVNWRPEFNSWCCCHSAVTAHKEPRLCVALRDSLIFGCSCLSQCFTTAGPRPGTGSWHQLYRAARDSPGMSF